MEEIEVVIKIPKILYAQIQSDAEIMIYSGMRSWKGILATLLRSVRNGTPLPKGHGDLKDFDKIEWYGCDFEDGKTCIKNRGNCDICTFANCDADQVRNLPTIIKADKGDE